MKLVRYGEKGAEKPGLIDKSGQLRDLSAHVKDLTGEAYSPESLKKLAALDPASLPAVSGKPRSSARWVHSRSSSSFRWPRRARSRASSTRSRR